MARAKRRQREDDDWEEGTQHRLEQAAAEEILKRPAQAQFRRDKFTELKNRREEANQANENVKDFRKDLSRVYGWHKKAVPLIVSLNKLEPVDRSHVLLDLRQAEQDYGWDEEASMLARLVNQGGDSGPVFDNTAAAAATPKRRGRPKGSKNKPPEPAPTPGIPLDEAQAKFEANQAKAPRLDDGDDENDESQRPRFLRRKSGESDPDLPQVRGGFKIVG